MCPGRIPVILLDSIGYGAYQDERSRPFLPADRFDVRLITDLAKLGEARGAELESVIGVTLSDEESVREAVEFQYRSGGQRAERIVCISEALLVTAARHREALGLPGLTVTEALQLRDKIIMKRMLLGNGIRVPTFAEFSVAAAHRLLDAYSRVVAKPRLGTGSMGVMVFDDHDSLDDFATVNADWLAEFEVEEFIDGTLYHVDSIVNRGRIVAATAGRTVDPTTAYETLTPCRDIGVGEGTELRTLLQFNEAVLGCLPDFSGVTHHEVFLSAGTPVFCEIAGRAGGGGVVAGFRSRTGVNLHELALSSQLAGDSPVSPLVADYLTGFVQIYAGTGVLREPLEPIDEPWVVETVVNARVGQRLARPKHWGDTVATVTVRGDAETVVAERLDEVVRRMRPNVA
jgi:hypothetical protein